MRRTMAFSRVSTGDLDIPASCEMKHEPEFKPLQGNPAFFWVRASHGPFHLRQKHRVPLTYLLLRENSTWGAGGKLAQIFNQRQGIISQLGTIWGAWSFPLVAVLILIFISTWDGYLRESLSIPQRSQATCTVCCGTWNSYGANDGEMHFIYCWFRLHRGILHSWVDIRVHLVLWQCSWGLSVVLSRKSRLLTCLIGNTILLCT